MPDSPSSGPDVPTLSPTDSRAYWDRRHRRQDNLAAGGHIGFDRGTNAMLYAVRSARLVEVLGAANDVVAPLRVLDAGCGQGLFARTLGSFGHTVDGIDTSTYAIDVCRELAGPSESYEMSALVDWQPSHLYDAVLSIDVLYHLMDDDEWASSVENLASLVRLGGLIGLVDHDADVARVWAEYQKTRPTNQYRDLLSGCGFEMRRSVRNDFRTDPSIMHVAVRVA
ncbi:class I SAM-dependent methyltransferase [Knoellia aerolata]|nr:class I SAM-dependent methyltransferase [Knoellia aerolata]